MPNRSLAQDITFYDLKSIFKNFSRAHLNPHPAPTPLGRVTVAEGGTQELSLTWTPPPHPWAGWLLLRVALRNSVFPVWTRSCLLGMWDEGWSRKLSVSILLPGKPKFRKEGTSAGGKSTCKRCGKTLIMSPPPPAPFAAGPSGHLQSFPPTTKWRLP